MMTGIHAIHHSVGMALASRLVWETAGRELLLSSPEIHATALYWRFVDVIWLILYPLFFLGGRE